MKNENIMLSLLVLGRIHVKRMDVYLQPLINETNKLWEGIHVRHVSKPILAERSFMLYGICAYIINDYLG
jgi:hypothetical protein